VNQLKVVGLRKLNALNSPILLMSLDHVLFANNRKVGLMGEQTEHDQISVSSIETMSCVWVVAFTASQLADVVEHFVLAFTWHRSITQHT